MEDGKMKKITIGRAIAGMLSAAFLCGASSFASFAEADAAAVQATIQSCLVNSDKNSVTVKAVNNANMEGTDGILYLVEQRLWRWR